MLPHNTKMSRFQLKINPHAKNQEDLQMRERETPDAKAEMTEMPDGLTRILKQPRWKCFTNNYTRKTKTYKDSAEKK